MPNVYPLMGTGKASFRTNAGAPLVGGTVEFLISGDVVAKDTYSDAAGTVLNTNPVLLDSRGEAMIYLLGNGAYKLRLRDALGNLIYTLDPVWGLVDRHITSPYIYTSKSANYVAVAGDVGNIFSFDATAAARSLTLPTAASVGNGYLVGAQKHDNTANVVTLVVSGADTLDNGKTSYTLLLQNDMLTLMSDGVSRWRVVHKNVQHFPLSLFTIADQSIADSTWLDVVFNASPIDQTVPAYVRRFRLNCSICFAANATGFRAARIVRQPFPGPGADADFGGGIPRPLVPAITLAGNTTDFQLMTGPVANPNPTTPNFKWSLQVWQNSGGNLTLHNRPGHFGGTWVEFEIVDYWHGK